MSQEKESPKTNYVTSKELWTLNLGVGTLAVSFFLGALLTFKGTIERSIDHHKTSTARMIDAYSDFTSGRISELEEDINIVQEVLMIQGEEECDVLTAELQLQPDLLQLEQEYLLPMAD